MIPAFLVVTVVSLYGPPSPFEFRETLVEVVEGGPVVVEVAVIYRGAAPVRHWVNTVTPSITAGQPPDWPCIMAPKGLTWHFGPGPCEADIRPGDTVASRILYVHQEFPSLIPQKATSFAVTWRERVWPADGSSARGEAVITRRVQITPEPFSPRVVERMEGRLRELRTLDAKSTECRLREEDLVHRLVDTSHAEFIPLAYDLLRESRDVNNRMLLREFILSFPGHVAEFDSWRLERAFSNDSEWGSLLAEWSRREWPQSLAST